MFKIEQSTEKIDDLEISKTTMDLSAILPPMFAPMLKIIVGEEFAMRQGAKGVFGIMSVGGDTGCYRMMLSAAAADKPIDQYAVIAQVGKHLHASKAGEMYLMPSRIESLVRAAIPRFMPGQDGGATVLPDAPIGASWTFQGRALDIRVFVPMDLLAGFRKLGESMENTRVPAPRQPEGGPAAIPPPVF
jgi:hypothetical protein